VRTLRSLTLLLTVLAAAPAPARAPDPHGLGLEIVRRLVARRTSATDINVTDFAGQNIGCILLPRRELRRYGYPGHAFFCETAPTGEVLGAVLNKKGLRYCYVSGAYAGDSCYDISVCDNAERLCVVQ
jgi:hypothetical protein